MFLIKQKKLPQLKQGETMNLTKEQLEQSKVYKGKSDLFKFEHPMDYAQPFIDIIESVGGTYDIKVEEVITNTERDGETENTSYGRVAFLAKLPEMYDVNADVNMFGHAKREIGFVYALDTAKPEMKVFSGNRISVCLNQCVFGADNVTAILMQASKPQVLYDKIRTYVDNATADAIRYKHIIEELASQEMTRSQLLEHVGEIVWFGRKEKQFGITATNDMVSYLQDEKTRYFVGDEQSHPTVSKLITYNALTESLKKTSLIQEASKTLLLEKIFKVSSLN